MTSSAAKKSAIRDAQKRDVQDRIGVASVAIYVCTHERNGPLRRTLDSLVVAAQQVQPQTEVAVVVVDDNPDGRAAAVVESFDAKCRLARGLHYRHSGSQNISTARNLGLDAGIGLADWVAMVDDDQVVAQEWLSALIEVQMATGADAVTGQVELRYPAGSPSWLTDQPFSDILEAEPAPDCAVVSVCSTGNSMLRTSFLVDNPEIRFRPDLGTFGGEDMVFYREAISAGLDARFAVKAMAWGEQPPHRSTYKHQLRTSYWLGNTEFLTNYESGDAGRFRLFLRGSRRIANAVVQPLMKLRQGEPPHWRFTSAAIARAVGMLVGVIGIKVTHK